MKNNSNGVILAIAGVLAVLSVLSFLTVLPRNGEFLLRVLSIIFLCMLLLRSRLSRIIFGEEKHWATLSIIAVCIVLSIRPIITHIIEPLEGGFLFAFFAAFNNSLDDAAIYAIGTICIAFLSIVFAITYKVKSPSILSMLGEKDKPAHLDAYTVRALVNFFVIIAFYILVFDIILQWASIIAGSATIITIVAMLFTAVVKQSTAHLSVKRIVIFLENLDEKIFGGLVALFHKRSTVLFGVAALLVFYPLSDMGAYILPYVTNIPSGIIMQLDMATHVPLPVLAYETALTQWIVVGFFGVLAYVLNAIAAIMMLFMPALFWFRIFSRKTLTIAPAASAIFVASVVCYLVAPAFSLGKLSSTSTAMVGVDIMTESLSSSPVVVAVVLALVAGLITYNVARRHPTQVSIVIIAFMLAFLTRYMMLYFSDIWGGLLADALLFFKHPNATGLIDGFLFLCFLATSAIFYVGSFAAFFYEVWVSLWHEHHKKTRRVWTH